MSWTAVVLAGSRPGPDPFAGRHGTDLKALIPVADRPMVAWPVGALFDVPQIERIRVLAQEPERIAAALPRDPRLSVEASGATIASTIERLLGESPAPLPLLVTTADHALLDPAMIADFVGKAQGADLAVGVVERRPLLARLPGTRRTWIRFRGGAYSGANLFAFGHPRASAAVALWRSVEQDRKKGWRMVAALGPWLLLGAIFRLRTLDQTLCAIGSRLGLSIRAVPMADPLAAVDVDKDDDHALVTAILERRA